MLLDPLPRLANRRDVQGLRAVAVVLVVLDHAGVPWLRGGYVGVDVFFVLSGFLISSILLHEATSSGRVRLGSFYARRARRILPAATVVLLATVVFAAVELPVSRVVSVVQDVRWAALFGANVHFSRLGTDYFQLRHSVSPVQHFWSLSVEEQFYLFWPALIVLVLWGAGRRSMMVLPIVLATIWVASLAWSVTLTADSPTAAYFSSATRAWEIATGALLAMAGNYLLQIPPAMRFVMSGVGLVAIASSATLFDGSTAIPGWRALLPVLGAASVIAAGAAGTVGAARLLEARALRYLGDLSYSLYLWHWPVLVLGAAYVGHARDTSETVTLLGLTALLAVLTFHAVENPIRRRRGWLAGMKPALVLWPLAPLLVFLASGGAGAYATTAFQARISGPSQVQGGSPRDAVRRDETPKPTVQEEITESLEAADARSPIPFPLDNYKNLQSDIWQHRFTCFSDWLDTDSRICPTGDPNASRTMVVYGDSHAGMWLPPISTMGKSHGYRVIPLVKVGCAPFDVEQNRYGAPYPQCPAFRAWALRQIQKLHPAVIVLAYRGLWAVDPAPGQTAEQAWSAGVASSLQRLTRLAPEVKIISDITALGYLPEDCLTDPRSTMASCTVPERRVLKVSNAITREAAVAAGASFIDVTDLVCQRHRCPLVVDHVITYRDDSHLSMTWTNRLALPLSRRLDPEGD